MKDKETHYRKLENMMHSAPIVRLTGARIKISARQAEIVPARKKLFHASDALHGEIYFLSLDNAAFFAVNSIVEDVFVLTTAFTTYLIRPVSEGEIKAIGRVLNVSLRRIIAEAVLYNSGGKELGRANGVFMKSRIPLDEKIGYC